MMTIASYSYEELLPFVGMNMPSKTFTTNEGSYKVHMSGVRMECLKRNHSCVWCHREGNVWLLQAGKRGAPKIKMNCFRENCPWCAKYYYSRSIFHAHKYERPHLNLFHKSATGALTLMTRDHIMAKSCGGSESIDNMQTMCRNCNSAKGSLTWEEFEIKMTKHAGPH